MCIGKVDNTEQQFSDMMNGRKLIKDTDIHKISTVLNVDANTLFRINIEKEGE